MLDQVQIVALVHLHSAVTNQDDWELHMFPVHPAGCTGLGWQRVMPCFWLVLWLAVMLLAWEILERTSWKFLAFPCLHYHGLEVDVQLEGGIDIHGSHSMMCDCWCVISVCLSVCMLSCSLKWYVYQQCVLIPEVLPTYHRGLTHISSSLSMNILTSWELTRRALIASWQLWEDCYKLSIECLTRHTFPWILINRQ